MPLPRITKLTVIPWQHLIPSSYTLPPVVPKELHLLHRRPVCLVGPEVLWEGWWLLPHHPDCQQPCWQGTSRKIDLSTQNIPGDWNYLHFTDGERIVQFMPKFRPQVHHGVKFEPRSQPDSKDCVLASLLANVERIPRSINRTQGCHRSLLGQQL